MQKFDLLILGGGSGGIAAANRAAIYGANVGIIESNLFGGTCVNRGCVPKKAGWFAARLMEAVDELAAGYGIESELKAFHYPEFIKARDAYVERSKAAYERTFEKNGIQTIQGYGKFVNGHTIEVNGLRYQADHILIATGGRPLTLDVPGADLLETSDDFFKWEQLPASVALVGAGYIAVELAQTLNSFGVETHLVVRHDRPLRRFDHTLSDTLMEAMGKSGLTLHTHTDFDAYRRNDQGLIECLKDGKVVLTVEKIILAIGRKPNVENLGLEHTKVQLDKKGKIAVNAGHETDEPGVYACGDVIDQLELTPVAIKSGRQIAEYLFNHAETSAIDAENVPTVIFTHPAIGTVGMSQEAAVKKYGQDAIKVYQSRFNSMYMSIGGVRQPCDFKLICLGDAEKVIGLHGIGEGVDEMLQGFALAIKMGATKSDFDSVVAIHPTGAEEFVTMR